MQSETTSKLILGWKVNSNLDPEYWLDRNQKPGLQDEEELITISSKVIANHTAILAQSGSGKSFFLGRLIEEIMVRTKANCIVLDPNADFTRARDVNEGLWKSVEFDVRSGIGALPHEATREDFLSEWNDVTIKILTKGVPRRRILQGRSRIG